MKVLAMICVFVGMASVGVGAQTEGLFYDVLWLSCYDGDTCKVVIPYLPAPFTEQTVRLRDIDTPEIRGKCEQEIMLAEQARMATIGWLEQATRVDLRRVTLGVYGRLVAEVWVDGEVSVNTLLLDSQLAVPSSGKNTQNWCLPLTEIFHEER